jgi:hypothetical protein
VLDICTSCSAIPRHLSCAVYMCVLLCYPKTFIKPITLNFNIFSFTNIEIFTLCVSDCIICSLCGTERSLGLQKC